MNNRCTKCKVGFLTRWYNRLFKCSHCGHVVLVFADEDTF